MVDAVGSVGAGLINNSKVYFRKISSVSSLTLFRLGFFGQSVTWGGGGSSDPPSVSLEPITLGS